MNFCLGLGKQILMFSLFWMVMHVLHILSHMFQNLRKVCQIYSMMHVKRQKKGNLSLKQQVRQIGNKFLTRVEICAQEAAYLLLQMPLRSSSRTVVFINTSEPAKRTFLLKSFEALQELPEGSNRQLD